MNARGPQPEQNEANPATVADLGRHPRIASGKMRKPPFKRKMILFLSLLLLGTIAFLGAYFLLRGERVYLNANNQATARVSSGADIRQAAFDSLRDSLPSPSPIEPTGNAPNVLADSSNSPPNSPAEKGRVAPPIDPGVTSTLSPPPGYEGHQTASRSTEDSHGRDQRPAYGALKPALATTKASVRFASIPQETSPERVRPPEDQPRLERLNADPARLNIQRITPPSFGSMLPIRLMGVLYTIRSGSLARFELMRDLKTEQWQLRRGTVFVGNVTGSGADRAFVQIKGFIDPTTDRFFKIDGEILGEDGGTGLRGKTRRVASVWSKALDRAARAGMQIATSILNRGASSVVVAADPYGAIPSLADRSMMDANSGRAFV